MFTISTSSMYNYLTELRIEGQMFAEVNFILFAYYYLR